MTFLVRDKYELNIGLEIHCQIISDSKLFSPSSAKFGGSPNTHVSFFDAGFPGQLPVLNKYCIEQAIKTGLGLNAEIRARSCFDRKHYFYADLPSGYQITQQFEPLVKNGWVEILDDDGAPKKIRINRLHVEQDAGKLTHDADPARSHVDFNRAGVGLMEIVSEPDLASPREVGEYVRKIRALVRYLGTCDGNMDEGSMRCDVNLSLRPKGSEKYGTRTETKNVNSVRFAMQAVQFEMERQADVLDGGKSVVQETRLFDAATGATRAMRNKENAIDYRYFRDPDIMPLVLEQGLVERIRASMPELPDAKKARFVSEYGLSEYDAHTLTAERELADYFEEAARGRDGKTVANWISSELFALLNKDGGDITRSPVSAAALGELVDLIKDGTISGKIAKEVFRLMYEGEEKSAKKIVEAGGLRQVSDAGAIERAVDDIIAANPENVALYRGGKTPLFGWFVGQVLKAMKGQANPAMVNEILKNKLG
ncbi:MAG: Asp-tRNA(Asn)/Glu-tRNA(Gln) amidotransferase subunit GatB [Rickettsiales bacterium]|jgi:aspartyl-tRNA(Asn)/glutamyl-tRNA(Gln) amidotransferase subunit B|nr:Asp-tRNA(Asn)/Glu-tRNA(Gln) amidotransferase subunit GatB [Rickettsiales bacterium]